MEIYNKLKDLIGYVLPIIKIKLKLDNIWVEINCKKLDWIKLDWIGLNEYCQKF